MANDRLTGLDASFLHLEDEAAHMHVAAVMTFDGSPPPHAEVVVGIRTRLHLVPRYRQKLAFVPFGQGRPLWVDDPHFNLEYHVRHTALPEPGSEEQLKRLAGRVFSQRLDRDKPLWEMWVVEGLDGGERFAVLSKTHHALVDGVSGIDIMSVLFDTKPEPDAPPPIEEKGWAPAPTPSGAQLLGEALYERAGRRPRPPRRGWRGGAGPPPPRLGARSCAAGRCPSGRRCPPRSPAAPERSRAARAGSRARRSGALRESGRWCARGCGRRR